MAGPDEMILEMNLGDPILDMDDDPILDMAGDPILDMGWADMKDDVLTEAPIVIFQGQRNGDPLDRVADAGTIKLVLNNNRNNTAGSVGLYSPDHPAKRLGFGNGTLVRVGLIKDAATEYLSQGRIIDLKPVPGLLNNKTVAVTAGDWIEVVSRTPMPRIPVQEGVTDDQVLQLIVDATDDPPATTDLGTGVYTYDYALHDVSEGATILAVLQRLIQNGLGRLYITGGPVSGEVLTYVDLYSLLTATGNIVATFVDDQIASEASRKAFKRVKRVVATFYPQEKDASTVVLFSLANEIAILAGQEIEFTAFFRDPNGASSSTIAAVDVVSPVIGTDLLLSSVAGSESGNLNGNLSILAVDIGSNNVYVRLLNSSGSTGYLTYQLRGKGLYPYDALTYTVEDSTIREGEGVTLNYDLVYHTDYYTAKEIADNLLAWYRIEITDMPSLEFVPTLDDDSYNKMIAAKPGTQVSVTESVTAIGYAMNVLGREISIWNGGKYITERLFITPAQQVENALYMELDVDGQSELDGPNTILGFG